MNIRRLQTRFLGTDSSVSDLELTQKKYVSTELPCELVRDCRRSSNVLATSFAARFEIEEQYVATRQRYPLMAAMYPPP